MLPCFALIQPSVCIAHYSTELLHQSWHDFQAQQRNIPSATESTSPAVSIQPKAISPKTSQLHFMSPTLCLRIALVPDKDVQLQVLLANELIL